MKSQEPVTLETMMVTLWLPNSSVTHYILYLNECLYRYNNVLVDDHETAKERTINLVVTPSTVESYPSIPWLINFDSIHLVNTLVA